jgi:SAM-dependent methyltransferase
MPVTVIDVRPLESSVTGLTFIQTDATYLKDIPDNSVESLSSLHAIEHFGLGRYGDPIDPEACFKAMQTLVRILKPGGRLYFSVPIGIERVQFNANYIFSPDTILNAFQSLELVSFGIINENGEFFENVSPHDYRDYKMVCGLFEFKKNNGWFFPK